MVQVMGKFVLYGFLTAMTAWSNQTFAENCSGHGMIDKAAVACLSQDLHTEIAELTQQYQSLMQLLPESAQKLLKENQQAWIKKRDSACLLDSRKLGQDAWLGKLERSDDLMLCAMKYVRNRSGQLDQWASDVKTGDIGSVSKQMSLTASDWALHPNDHDAEYQMLTKNSHKRGLWYLEATINGDAISKLTGKKSTALEIMCVDPAQKKGNGWLAYSGESDFHESTVIGIALDLNRGKIYVGQNGAWLNGMPGKSGGGDVLLGGDFVCGIHSMLPIEDLVNKDIININFGENHFVYDAPKGYQPFYSRPTWFHVEDSELTLSVDYKSIDLSGAKPTALFRNDFRDMQTLSEGGQYQTAYSQIEVDCTSMQLKPVWSSNYANSNSVSAIGVKTGSASTDSVESLGKNSFAGGLAKTLCFLKKNGFDLPSLNSAEKWDSMASPNPGIRIFEAVGARQFKNGFMLVKQKNEFTADVAQYGAKVGNLSMGITAYDCNRQTANQIFAARFDDHGLVLNGGFYSDDDARPKLPENRKRFADACMSYLSNPAKYETRIDSMHDAAGRTESSVNSLHSQFAGKGGASKATADLRYCLELKTNAEIIACAGQSHEK